MVSRVVYTRLGCEVADLGSCGFRGLEVFFLTCARGDRARPWFPASGARMPCAPRRYPCAASRTRRAAADNRACGDGVGMEGVRVVVGVDCGCDDGYDRLGLHSRAEEVADVHEPSAPFEHALALLGLEHRQPGRGDTPANLTPEVP